MGVEPTLPAWEAGALPLSYRRACGRHLSKIHGGRGGIRTHGRLAPTTVFKTAALDLSATRPRGAYYTIIFGATATASRVAAKKKTRRASRGTDGREGIPENGAPGGT